MKRHGIEKGKKKQNNIDLPSTNEIKKSRNEMCKRKSSLRAPSKLAITKKDSLSKIKRELKTMM